jgi:L-ornithine N5-oxygenase
MRFPVRRDYKVDFDEQKLDGNAGIWLQGCNEKTHGVSSILFTSFV